MHYTLIVKSLFSTSADKKLKLDIQKYYKNYALTDVKIIKGFYIGGEYEKKTIKEIAEKVIIDPLVEKIFINSLPVSSWHFCLEITFKPGVVDNLARTLKVGLQDYLKENWVKDTKLKSTTWFLLKGKNLTKKKIKIIADNLLFNPLIQEINITPLNANAKTLFIDKNPFANNQEKLSSSLKYFETIDLLGSAKSQSSLEKLSREKMYALNIQELEAIIKHYQKPSVKKIREKLGLPKNPTDVEMEILAQTWSEHCKHKIFSAHIEYYESGRQKKVINSLYQEYIKKPTFTLKAKRKDLLSVFSDNAGIFAFNEKYAIAMKVETHNSPSALEPFGGAITGILGVNRDILGTGKGAEPLFNTNVFCFADPFYRKVIPKKLLHPQKIFKGVHRGIEKGGNQSGIPTINGAIVFDDSFLGKPLVFCGTGGIIPRKIKKEFSHEKKIHSQDLIVMVGGRIGKDGIHGATFSSGTLLEDSPTSVVQIGDSFTQKKMTDFLLAARDKDLYQTLTDNGAGGLSSSIGEMATISGGAEVHLELALLKYPALQPWEIIVSESQERMTLAVNPKKIKALMQLAKLYDCEISVLGHFTNSGFFSIYYHKKIVAHLAMDFLHEGNPQLQLTARYHPKKFPEPSLKKINLNRFFLKLIQSKNIASKEHWVRQYDHEVKAQTILKPFDGESYEAPMDGGGIKPLADSKAGLIVTNGILSRYSKVDTYEMARAVVDEAVRNYVACGGDIARMYGLDNFCWPDPIESAETPDGEFKLAQLVRANFALKEMVLAYNLPLISGKDSMKNDYGKGKEKISVLPTLLFTLIGIIPDVKKTMTTFFKRSDSLIFLLGETKDELGASEAYDVLGYVGNRVPQVSPKKNFALYKKVFEAIQKDLILACHDVSDGGLAVALGESAWGGNQGIEVDLNNLTLESSDADLRSNPQEVLFKKLFSESAGRLIIEVANDKKEKVEKHFASSLTFLGTTKEEKTFTIKQEKNIIINHPLDNLKKLWKESLIF